MVVVGRAIDRERDDRAGAGEVHLQDPGAEGLAAQKVLAAAIESLDHETVVRVR